MNTARSYESKGDKQSLRELQTHWLLSCLQRNQHTCIGQKYGFKSIKSAADFQARLPISDYEHFRPYVDRMAQGECHVLFHGDAVAYELTSGSTQLSKLIPYSEDSLKDFQRAIAPWLKSLISRLDCHGGSTYWSLSPVSRTVTQTLSGIPIGLPDTAYLGDAVQCLQDMTFVAPAWLANISNIQDWQRLTLYWLLLHDDLVLVSIWSPSFFTVLVDAIDTHAESLSELFRMGGNYQGYHLKANWPAYERLQCYLSTRNCDVFWPHLKLISCWADGSSTLYVKQLKRRFPNIICQPKGLLMTEAVITVPNAFDRTVLTPSAGFYEFLKGDDIYLAHELHVGECYEVVVTTAGGLYRYCTQDQVRCESYENDLPVLKFIGRVGLQSDLVGEKLTDVFIADSIQAIDGFAMLVPMMEPSPGYRLVMDKNMSEHLEAMTDKVEHALCRNPHYAYARKLGQLHVLQGMCIDSPLQQYIQCRSQAGVRYGDIKIPALSLDPIWMQHIAKEYT